MSVRFWYFINIIIEKKYEKIRIFLDFSDSLNKKRRGYRSGNYVLEIVGSENKDNETIEQKIERLRFELEELTLLIEKKVLFDIRKNYTS